MMNPHSAGSHDEAMLSDAAAQALDELLEDRRDQVLEVARRASPSDVLTAADIVRAYYSSEERPSTPSVPGPIVFRRAKKRTFWGLSAVVVATLLSLTIATYTFAHSTSAGSENAWIRSPLLSIVLASVGLAVSLAIAFFGRVADSYANDLRASKVTRIVNGAYATYEIPRDLPSGVISNKSGEVIEPSIFLFEWGKVEDRLRRLANSADRASGRTITGRRPIGEVLAVLLFHRVIDDALAADLRKVVALRNMVAHGETVPQERLQEGYSLLHTVEERLEKLQHGLKPTA